MQICLGTANIFNNYGLSHKNKIKKDFGFLSKINKSNLKYFDLSNGYRNTTKFYKNMYSCNFEMDKIKRFISCLV